MTSNRDYEIGFFAAGDLDADELNQAISEAWSELVADDAARADIAAEFGVESSSLLGSGSPFATEVSSSGSLVGEVVIFLGGMVAQSFLQPVIDHGRDKVLAAARRVWKKHLERKVSPPGSNKLGKSKEDDRS